MSRSGGRAAGGTEVERVKSSVESRGRAERCASSEAGVGCSSVCADTRRPRLSVLVRRARSGRAALRIVDDEGQSKCG